MRTGPLSLLSLLLAVLAAALILFVPEQVALAMVVAPVLIILFTSMLLFTRQGGWRGSHGVKEWLLYGPVQAAPDALSYRVARVPGVLLCLAASLAVGAVVGMILVAVVPSWSVA
jgi:hypothetical protein